MIVLQELTGQTVCVCFLLSCRYTAEEFITIDESFIKELGLAAGLSGGAATNHRFGLFSIFESMKKRVYSKLMQKGEPFPSLMVTKDSLEPKGSYAEAQVKYVNNVPLSTLCLPQKSARRKSDGMGDRIESNFWVLCFKWWWGQWLTLICVCV